MYMAISPTMNDQWSGKILSMAERNQLEEPRRSSTQSNACCCCRARLRAAERSATVLMAVHPCCGYRCGTSCYSQAFQLPALFQKPGPIGSMKSLRAIR